MSLNQREICRVGESPTQGRRSLSPRRKSTSTTIATPEKDQEPTASADSSPTAESKPSQSSPEIIRSPSRSDRRISTRLLQGKESPTKSFAKSPKHANWKTSKFFSRSMASGELLKGLKKLSTSSTGTTATTPTTSGEEAAGTPPGEKEQDSKSFKSRFSSLRRKSGSDTDNVPNVDSESLKLGSAEVRGIVCKKEDLMSLIQVPVPCSKERRVSSPAELIVPVVSTMPSSPIPVLKSPSLKVAPNSPLNRGSFRSSRSNSLDPTQLPATFRPPPTFRPPVRTVVHPPPPRRVSDDICLKKTGSFLEVVPEVKRRLSGPLIEVKERIIEENEEGSEVQWDEGNFVDPNLLGGAIEAFLKGMGSSPTSTPTTDKRVSFKKSLIK